MRVLVDRRRLVGLVIELHDRAVVVLRDQQVAVLVSQDAIGVVATDLPDLGPFLTIGDHAGNGLDRVLGWRWWKGGRRRRRCRGSPSRRAARAGAGGATGPAGTSRRSGCRRLARANQIVVAGILRRL